MGERLYSDLPVKTYMSALKSDFESPFSVFRERVTGIAIGPFFSVAHHCEYEWNRRITSECNRAIGFVRTVEGRTQVNFVRTRGCLSLSWMLFWMLLFCFFVFLTVGRVDFAWFLGSVIISLFICGASAFTDSLTEQGQEGAGQVTKLLLWPDKYF